MTVPKITKARRNNPRIHATIPEVIMRSPSIPVNLREYDKGLHIAGPSTFQVTSENFLHAECTKQFNKENLSIEKQAHCKARSMVVHLHTDEGEVKPSAVLTKYCSGSCKMGRVCKATQTANKTISVQILWYSGKESMCRTVLIPEDRKCKCVCSQNKSSCTAQQKFNKKICQCECQNQNERLHCEKKANKTGLHEWDDQTCSCVCREEKPCSTGTSWDKKICACSKRGS
ncbi:balbiani ring protein 3-like isoform X1 [Sitophilus oryzae]|uniref:Balbiani ring protein 3-like isoform X1 n=1 Tax=Sitophilus oryzae TaxID=7048 RepID=A0A6J2XQ70_SITOR|nr:balbiani ring protein 3-like isoform X1 [Sitophilus oryzae]